MEESDPISAPAIDSHVAPASLPLHRILPPTTFPRFSAEPRPNAEASTSTHVVGAETAKVAIPSVLAGPMPPSTLLNIAAAWTASSERLESIVNGQQITQNRHKGENTGSPQSMLVLTPSRSQLHHDLVVEDSQFWRDNGGEAMLGSNFDGGRVEFRYCDSLESASLLLNTLHLAPDIAEHGEEPANPFAIPAFPSHRSRGVKSDSVMQIARTTNLIIAHDLLSFFAEKDAWSISEEEMAVAGKDPRRLAEDKEGDSEQGGANNMHVRPSDRLDDGESRPRKKRKITEQWKDGACIEDYLSLLSAFRQSVQQLSGEAGHLIRGLVLEPSVHGATRMPTRSSTASNTSFSPVVKSPSRDLDLSPLDSPSYAPQTPIHQRMASSVNPFNQNFSPSARKGSEALLGPDGPGSARGLPGMANTPSPSSSPSRGHRYEVPLVSGGRSLRTPGKGKKRAAAIRMEEIRVIHGLEWLFGDLASANYRSGRGTADHRACVANGVYEIKKDEDENPFLDADLATEGARDQTDQAEGNGLSIGTYKIVNARTDSVIGRYRRTASAEEGSVYEWNG